MNITGAYGRIYDTAAEVERDWNKGADFRLIGTQTYCSKRNVNPMDSVYFQQLEPTLATFLHYGVLT